MQILASSILGSDVFSVHAGHNVGTIKSWFIDSKDLKIVLFKISSQKNDEQYLLSEDVRSLGVGQKNLVIIDSTDKLSEKEDLIRQKELIEKSENLIGYKVVTTSSKTIGKVKDLSIDFQDLYIQKLHVKAKLPQRIIQERLLIDRSDVLEINGKVITIKEDYVKTQNTVKKALPAQ